MLLDRYDYHIHTNYSDGVLSPEQIVDRYIKRGFEAISVTDHDNIDGSRIAFEYARDKNIKIIPGIEISTVNSYGYEIHVLGYYIDYDSEDLINSINLMDKWRNERNDRLIAALNKTGYEVSVAELYELNSGRFIGKPTVARLLVNKGYISSVDEAFLTVFKKLEIGHIKKKAFHTDEAIKLIHKAGGKAVFAHPMELKQKEESKDEFKVRLLDLLGEMRLDGIDGIECFHPSATNEEEGWLEKYSNLNKLIITGGSDFHSDEDRRFKYEN